MPNQVSESVDCGLVQVGECRCPAVLAQVILRAGLHLLGRAFSHSHLGNLRLPKRLSPWVCPLVQHNLGGKKNHPLSITGPMNEPSYIGQDFLPTTRN